jgi:hypothetical protein
MVLLAAGSTFGDRPEKVRHETSSQESEAGSDLGYTNPVGN